MQYWVWKAVSSGLRVLPLRVCYAIASLAGTVAFLAWPRGRRATTKNFRIVLGKRASKRRARQLARASLVNYCRYLVDFARLSEAEPAMVAKLVDDDGAFERLATMRAAGTGVIVTSTHFGNWDAGAVAIAQRGFPATVIAEGFGDARLDAAVLGARERSGLHIVRMGSRSPAILRALKAGHVLAVVVDRPARGPGVPIQFFGRKTRVPDGAARLALRTGAPVVAAVCERVHPDQQRWRVRADFDVPRPPDPNGVHAAQELTQSIFSAHEAMIRQAPDQWYMFRDMWPAVRGD